MRKTKVLYDLAKEMLFVRSGTDFEDMYWFDGNTGKEFESITNMTTPSIVKYLPGFMEKHASIKNKVTIHNHPRSMPPSISDFESAYRNEYSLGIIVSHDGTVYTYKNITDPQPELYDSIASNFRAMGYSEFTIEVMTLDEMMSRGVLEYRKVH